MCTTGDLQSVTRAGAAVFRCVTAPYPAGQHRYEPVEPSAWAASPARATPPPESAGVPPPEEGAPLVERRRLLPDRRLVHGRMYLAAWQAGLDGVADTAVDVVMLAVQVR